MPVRKRKRTTAFGSCMRRKLKGRRFTSKRTARKALGSAARSCARKRRGRVPHTRAMLRRMRRKSSLSSWG
jgi:hypothetical protein